MGVRWETSPGGRGWRCYWHVLGARLRIHHAVPGLALIAAGIVRAWRRRPGLLLIASGALLVWHDRADFPWLYD